MASDHDVRIPLPFSVADVFDYLIPGATFLAVAAMYDYRVILRVGADPMDTDGPIWELFHIIAAKVFAAKDPVLSLLFVSGLAIACYVVGHIASSFSSLCIDRVLIFKGHGYPYRFLLKLHQKKFDRQGPHTYHGSFYRGLFFWLNLALFSAWTWTIFLGAPWRLFALVCSSGVVLSCLSKFAISNSRWRKPGSYTYRFRRWLVTQRRAIKRQLEQNTRIPIRSLEVAQWCLNRFKMNSIWKLYAKPYDGLAHLYTTYTNSQGPLEEPIRHSYAKHFKERFGCEPHKVESSNFWLTSFFVMERSAAFSKMTLNWLRLYEFARNLSTALYLGFIYCLVSAAAHRTIVRATGDAILRYGPIVLLCMAFMMLGRYYYLYVCYLSKFTFRAFVYLNCLDEAPLSVEEGGYQGRKESGTRLA